MGISYSKCGDQKPFCPWAALEDGAELPDFPRGGVINETWFGRGGNGTILDDRFRAATWFAFLDQPTFNGPDDVQRPSFWVEADSDVAGLGVLLSFGISAISSVLVALLAWFFTSRHFRSFIVKRSRQNTFNSLPIVKAIYALNLALGDSQMITGIAMFGAIFHQQCTISAYHYEIVTWMFLISIVTTASTSFIGISTASFRGTGRKIALGCRLLAILTLVSLCSVFPNQVRTSRTGWPRFHQPAMGTAAICYLRGNEVDLGSQPQLARNGSPFVLGLVSVAVTVTVGFGLRFLPFPTWIAAIISIIPAILLILAVIFAGYNIASLRTEAYMHFLPGDNESEWGFGQIIPVVLLVLPLIAFLQTLSGFDDLDEPYDAVGMGADDGTGEGRVYEGGVYARLQEYWLIMKGWVFKGLGRKQSPEANYPQSFVRLSSRGP